MTHESADALCNLEQELILHSDMKHLAMRIKNGDTAWHCKLMQVTGLNYDGLEKLRDVLFDLRMYTDPAIDNAAREFVEKWLKYDGVQYGLQIRRDENQTDIQDAV